ncbi:MAG: SH3 domain-containing protein [Gemmatimonadota bacterium]|nr:SH3 domain-containing protein [Gemmatimonadota bacterium]
MLTLPKTGPSVFARAARSLAPAALLLVAVSCASGKPKPAVAPKPVAAAPKPRVVYDTVLVKDLELERRLMLLELQLLEKEAQVEDLEVRLVDTRTAVVRAMGKAQTATSRAEAASGMAEAEVALQSLRASRGQNVPETMQVTHLVKQSSLEFDRKNYGGALYLANQAKSMAVSYRARVASAGREETRPGEKSFALPIRLKVESKGNVREGPGTNFGIVFGVDSGAVLTAHSYTEDWIRINDERGRNGWIFRNLVARP